MENNILDHLINNKEKKGQIVSYSLKTKEELLLILEEINNLKNVIESNKLYYNKIKNLEDWEYSDKVKSAFLKKIIELMENLE